MSTGTPTRRNASTSRERDPKKNSRRKRRTEGLVGRHKRHLSDVPEARSDSESSFDEAPSPPLSLLGEHDQEYSDNDGDDQESGYNKGEESRGRSRERSSLSGVRRRSSEALTNDYRRELLESTFPDPHPGKRVDPTAIMHDKTLCVQGMHRGLVELKLTRS